MGNLAGTRGGTELERHVHASPRFRTRPWRRLGRQVTLRVGIVGCGLIGQRRAKAIGGAGRIVACADLDEKRARAAAVHEGARIFSDWRELVALPDVDVVIVATRHDTLAAITLAAVETGKHVLVEKPAGRSPSELEPVIAAAERHEAKVHVGFN